MVRQLRPRVYQFTANGRLIIQSANTLMGGWHRDELAKIAEADDSQISPFREDGVTYGTPTWIWSVVVDDALYVRA